MDYTEAEEDLRGLFGVTETELPDALIHRLSNLPAAELAVQQQVSESLIDLTDENLLGAKLAVLYTAAANCLQAVRMNILMKESDTKTVAVRFKDTLTLTEDYLLGKAGGYLNNLPTAIAVASVDQLSFVFPSTDVITGMAND